MSNRKVVVDTNRVIGETDALWGIFFEDINHAADGGLYAEMVQNRSFAFLPIDRKDYHPLTAWQFEGNGAISVETEDPCHEKNPTYANIIAKGSVKLTNAGFNSGFAFVSGDHYDLTIFARSSEPQTITVSLCSTEGRVYARTEMMIITQWQMYEAVLCPDTSDDNGRLSIELIGNNTLCLDTVSLFPQKTYKNRKRGLRQDLAQKLEELQPAFMRFPGGCLVHDGSLNPDDRDALYFWKNSIGEDPYGRPPRRNNWSYNQTLGLGYYEYFELCEDIGCQPLPVLAAAYNPHRHITATKEELDFFVQDALDLIEFARGNKDTKWGAVRSSLGHPEPFGLRYLAIGNEELGQEFCDNYPYFHNAIREKYPDVKLITTAGPFMNGEYFEYYWDFAKKIGADYIDEHYYMIPQWLLNNVHRYDSYERGNTKVFLGEYASWGNSMFHAVAEAAAMTGIERNADVVGLACYAPLFCNIDYINWSTNLIWFDNKKSYNTPNYYVQQMFMRNSGKYAISARVEGSVARYGEKPVVKGMFDFITDNGNKEFDCLTVNGMVAEPDKTFAEGKTILKLRGKKKDGNRGFDVIFGKTDNENFYTWQIGGWGNDVSILDRKAKGIAGAIDFGPMIEIKKDCCYDIEIEYDDNRIICRLNGKVMHDITVQTDVINDLYASAGKEEDGTVIVKVVNVTEELVKSEIDVIMIETTDNLKKISIAGENTEVSANITVLAAASEASNTFDEPMKIVPQTRNLQYKEGELFEFPPCSVTIIRLNYCN